MYRVFLADADADARDFYRSTLAQLSREFRIVGEAQDGETALVLIRDMQPDILIADMSLPFLDSVTLCRMIHRELPWVRYVLIGGSGDPARRREAEALGNCETLMRPVRAYELEDAVSRAADSAERSRRTLEDKIFRARSSISFDRMRREQMLLRWVLNDAAPFPDVPVFGKYARLLTMDTSALPRSRVGIATGILRLLEQEPDRSVVMFALELPKYAAIVLTSDDSEELEDAAYRTAETALRGIEHFTGERMSFAVSPCVEDLKSLRTYCLQRISAPQSPRRIYGPGDVIRRSPGTPRRISALTDFMLCADEDTACARMSALMRMSADWSGTAAAACAGLICEATEESRPMEPGEFDRICAEWTPQPDRESVLEQLRRAVRLRDSLAPQLKSQPVSRARSYIAGNIRKPGIPLYAAAREAGMSAGRFSVVFAQEMGMNFSEYLVNLRVNAAKVLLQITRMRPSSIAHRVGYTDERHFASLFRQYAGMTMQEYRKRCTA